MGEIQGGTLSYFIKSTGPRPARLSGPPLALDEKISKVTVRGEEPACNALLVGSVLAKRLKVDFGGGENNDGRGDLIGLVCRPHPLRPEQTIVALFHALADKQGQPIEDKKGFVYAVVDIRRKQLVAVYRETIDEDAATRIGAASLQIDTARYNLAPGVRALGVRMNIGYGPRCAEGGESDFLTLFIEDGRQLRPVLKNLAMSAWRITQGSNNCGQGGSDVNYTIDSVTLMLEMAATSAAGWRDIDVVAQHTIEVFSGPEGTPAKQETRKQSLGKLRAEKRYYATTNLLDRLWP
jgi:hypothetical protein